MTRNRRLIVGLAVASAGLATAAMPAAAQLDTPTVDLYSDQSHEQPQAALGELGVRIGSAAPHELRGTGHRSGAKITRVLEGSPAERARLRPGDIIVELNGRPVDERQLDRMISRLGPDEPLRLSVLRGGQEHTLRLEPIEARAGFESPQGQIWITEDWDRAQDAPVRSRTFGIQEDRPGRADRRMGDDRFDDDWYEADEWFDDDWADDDWLDDDGWVDGDDWFDDDRPRRAWSPGSAQQEILSLRQRLLQAERQIQRLEQQVQMLRQALQRRDR